MKLYYLSKKIDSTRFHCELRRHVVSGSQTSEKISQLLLWIFFLPCIFFSQRAYVNFLSTMTYSNANYFFPSLIIFFNLSNPITNWIWYFSLNHKFMPNYKNIANKLVLHVSDFKRTLFEHMLFYITYTHVWKSQDWRKDLSSTM